MKTDFDTLTRQSWEALSVQISAPCDAPLSVLSAREGRQGHWRVVVLCEAATLFAQGADVPAFSLVPPDWAAMYDAIYPALSVDSVNSRFFAGIRLLRIWVHTPRPKADRILRRAHIWQGTRMAATRLLLGTT